MTIGVEHDVDLARELLVETGTYATRSRAIHNQATAAGITDTDVDHSVAPRAYAYAGKLGHVAQQIVALVHQCRRLRRRGRIFLHLRINIGQLLG